jgi:hypothetical protein
MQNNNNLSTNINKEINLSLISQWINDSKLFIIFCTLFITLIVSFYTLSNSISQNEHNYSFSKLIKIGTLNGKPIDNYLTLKSKLDFNGFDILAKDRGRDSSGSEFVLLKMTGGSEQAGLDRMSELIKFIKKDHDDQVNERMNFYNSTISDIQKISPEEKHELYMKLVDFKERALRTSFSDLKSEMNFDVVKLPQSKKHLLLPITGFILGFLLSIFLVIFQKYFITSFNKRDLR